MKKTTLKLLKEYIQSNQPPQQNDRDFYVDSYMGNGEPEFLVQVQGDDDLVIGSFSNSTLAKNALDAWKRCNHVMNEQAKNNYYIIHRISRDPAKESVCKRKMNEGFLGLFNKKPYQKLLANNDFKSACNGYYHSQTRQARDLWRAKMNQIALEILDEKDFGNVESVNRALSDVVVKAYQNWEPTARMDEIIREEIQNVLRGGKGDRTDPKSVDQKELSMGIKTEFEHTNDREKAKEIALDHLTEDPRYYSKLKKAGLADELSS